MAWARPEAGNYMVSSFLHQLRIGAPDLALTGERIVIEDGVVALLRTEHLAVGKAVRRKRPLCWREPEAYMEAARCALFDEGHVGPVLRQGTRQHCREANADEEREVRDTAALTTWLPLRQRRHGSSAGVAGT
jgi:hypothetical protein